MAALVDTISTWVWIAAGLVAVIGGVYGAVRVLRRWKQIWRDRRQDDFRAAVLEVLAPMLEQVNEKLEHLHGCIERVGQEAITHAATGVAATEAAAAAAEAREESP